MTTRADFLTGLRMRLRDPDGRRWPDDELLAYLKAAVDEYSKLFPRLREQQFTPDGTSRAFDLPPDLLDRNILEVAIAGEMPGNTERQVYHKTMVSRGNRWYEVLSDKLIFGWVPAGNTTIRVRYEALHDLPAAGHASIPSEDEEMIYVAAMAMAWQRLAGNDANLSRWREEGRRDDSPVIPIHVDLWNRFRRMVDQKRSGVTVIRKVRRRWMRPVR